jgi:phosphonate transport system substrate-binding protein
MHWIGASLFTVVISLTNPLVLAFAQDCQREDLDKAYCDHTGNLVADPPADPRQLISPSTLIFAYTPVEDPAVYLKTWDGFIKHMEKTTGKKVVFFPVQSNAAEIEAMRSGRLHVAGFNTGSVPIAVNCAGFVPFAIMGTQAGQFGYEMEIIVPADSAIKTPANLKGKKVAFTAPRPPTRDSRRHRRFWPPNLTSSPTATSRQFSRASTTIRSSALLTTIMMPPPSPTK